MLRQRGADHDAAERMADEDVVAGTAQDFDPANEPRNDRIETLQRGRVCEGVGLDTGASKLSQQQVSRKRRAAHAVDEERSEPGGAMHCSLREAGGREFSPSPRLGNTRPHRQRLQGQPLPVPGYG